MTPLWTPARLEELEQFAPALTAEAVAERLGLELAQVLGKARRLGLAFGTGSESPLIKPATPVVAAPLIAPETPPARPGAIDIGDPREGWSERRISALQQLHGQGLTASEMAIRLRGVSKNSVISKLNWLRAKGVDLERRSRGAPSEKPRQPKPAPAPKSSVVAACRPKPLTAPKPTPPAAIEAAQKRFDVAVAKLETVSASGRSPDSVDILGLTHNSCRFPLWAFSAGPDEPRLYCGARKVGELSPYCARHTTLAFTPSLRRAS